MSSRINSEPTSIVPPNTHTTTGILLWGPPGCGKSSSAQRLKTLYSPMYFINTDAIVESIMKNYFERELISIKMSTIEAERQAFYWKMRSIAFHEITSLHESITAFDVINTIFNDVYANVAIPTKDEVNLYIRSNQHLLPLNKQHINEFMGNFTIFLTKNRKHHFMIETTGSNFNREWAEQAFAGTRCILQVVFVSSSATLIDRVSKRTDQLINASPDRIIETYNKSYFDSFTNAVNSNLFDEIIVDVNDSTPLNVLHVLKVLVHSGTRGSVFSYTIQRMIHYTQRDRDPTLIERQFIQRLLTDVSLSPEFIQIGQRTVHQALKFTSCTI